MIIPNLTPEKQYTFSETFSNTPDASVTVTILSPSGLTVTTGPALLTSGNNYTFQWQVPSSPEFGGWLAKWEYTYSAGTGSEQRTRGFNVRPVSEVVEFKQVSLLSEQVADTVDFFLPYLPDTLEVLVQRIGTMEGTKLVPETILTTSLADSSPVVIAVPLPDGTYRYDLTVPALISGEYLVTWKYRATPTEPQQREISVFWSVPPVLFSFIKQLRLYVDKIQKRIGIIQAYSDGELVNNFVQGLQIINAVTPLSSWSFTSLPWRQFEHFLLKAASLWTLRTQYMVEGDLAFDYSGQSISLNHDHLGFLDTEIGRLENDLYGDGFGKLPHTKVQYGYNTGVSMVVGVRTYRPQVIPWGG